MPRKKPKKPGVDNRVIVTRIIGRHPDLRNLHRLTLYDNGEITIERKDYLSRNPISGKIERTSYSIITEKYVQRSHQWLWDLISKNRVACCLAKSSTSSAPGQAS